MTSLNADSKVITVFNCSFARAITITILRILLLGWVVSFFGILINTIRVKEVIFEPKRIQKKTSFGFNLLA